MKETAVESEDGFPSVPYRHVNRETEVIQSNGRKD